MLFGRGGTGGIVNRVTKKAVTSQNFTHLNLGLNTFGATDLAIDSNLILGINSGLRINLHTDQLENHRDYFFGNRFGVNPSLTLNLSVLDLTLPYHTNTSIMKDLSIEGSLRSMVDQIHP